MSSEVIDSLQGMKMDALVQSWSVMVRIESKPLEIGSLTMKSMAITWNGSASGFVVMGNNRGFCRCVLTLLAWHVAHPFTYSSTSCSMLGHQ